MQCVLVASANEVCDSIQTSDLDLHAWTVFPSHQLQHLVPYSGNQVTYILFILGLFWSQLSTFLSNCNYLMCQMHSGVFNSYNSKWKLSSDYHFCAIYALLKKNMVCVLQFLPIAYTLFSEFGSSCQNSTHKPIRHSTWRLTTHIYAKMKHCNQNLTFLSKK